MAGAAGRRNILRELTTVAERGDINIRNSLLTLTPPSPDESVIQHRGHHRKSATYNYDAPDPVFFKTPTKSPKKAFASQKVSTPVKFTPVRSSPRKRLNLTPEKINSTEAGIAEISLGSKRIKKSRLQSINANVQLEKGIKALSHAQLVELINNAAKMSPEIEQIFSSLFPIPDLAPVEERLRMLQRNVLKSIPRNVWGSQDGTFCFLRVRTHLEAFKKECLELCRQFMESQHWPTVFEYILIAFKLSVALPNWTYVAHNKIKSACVKQLAAHCVNAFKKSNLDAAALSEVIERLEEFQDDAEVKICIKFAEDLMKNKV